MTTSKKIIIHPAVQDLESSKLEAMALIDPIDGVKHTIELTLRAYNLTRQDIHLQFRKSITITEGQ